MSTSIAACAVCLRYRGSKTCGAFPDEIPDTIFSGKDFHLEPYPGDNGKQFLPINADARSMVEALAGKTKI